MTREFIKFYILVFAIDGFLKSINHQFIWDGFFYKKTQEIHGIFPWIPPSSQRSAHPQRSPPAPNSPCLPLQTPRPDRSRGHRMAMGWSSSENVRIEKHLMILRNEQLPLCR